jgi:hypothetical protein
MNFELGEYRFAENNSDVFIWFFAPRNRNQWNNNINVYMVPNEVRGYLFEYLTPPNGG